MSTLKEKAQEVLDEKNNKLATGEFLENETIFGISGTFRDNRDNYIYAEQFPGVSDEPDNNRIVVTSQVNEGDTVINPITTIESRVDYDVIAESIGLIPEVIKEGETVLGINGIVEELNGDVAIITPSVEPQTIYPDAPTYNAFTSVEVEAVDETIDPNIVPENIRDGVSILGVVGNVQEGIDTSDATATETDILFGKTAYIDGVKVTGEIPTYDYSVDTSAVQIDHITDDKVNDRLNMVVNIDSCAYSNGVFIEPETDMPTAITYAQLVPHIGLTADKIKKDETILGVTGTADILDTSDATATGYDIAMGKTAYIDGEKFVGTIPVYDEYTYDKMTPSVGSLVGTSLEIVGTMGNHTDDTIILRPNAKVKLSPRQAEIASAAGLTADKLKFGENVLGITGRYQGGDIKTLIQYAYNTFIVHCGVIVNALTNEISEGRLSGNYRLDLTTSGLSSVSLKLCDIAPTLGCIGATGTIAPGYIGLAVDLQNAETALVFVDGDGVSHNLGALDAHSSSPYYTSTMTVNDFIAAIGNLGDVELDISQGVLDNAWAYNDFKTLYYYFVDNYAAKRGLIETVSECMDIGDV